MNPIAPQFIPKDILTRDQLLNWESFIKMSCEQEIVLFALFNEAYFPIDKQADHCWNRESPCELERSVPEGKQSRRFER